MPEVQRSESLRSANEGETGDLPSEVHTASIVVETRLSTAGSPVATRKLPERSVSFNRDVHVKRIGRGAPRVTAALVGDGEGRLIATPVHKESITSRSKEDLALEAAHVLEQVGNVNCVARDNRRLPGKFSTLPARRNKKRSELALETRRRSVEIGGTSEECVDTPRAKKKALERSASDASSSHKLKSPLAKFFSPKLERKWKPTVKRSVSDAGAASKEARSQRKRSGSSDSEAAGSQQNGSRAKKPLSPIIEASPQIDKPFDFTDKRDSAKSKQAAQVLSETQPSVEELTRVHEIFIQKPPKSPPKSPDSKRPLSPSVESRKIIYGESSRKVSTLPRDRSPVSATVDVKVTIDEVDQASLGKTSDMLHSSRYDQQHGGSGASEESSTIHKMIHRLTADRSPPPQLTRTMVSPGPGFGHNNNRPFSYTRPNNSSENNSPSPPHHQQSSVIYAQVQMDKKNKAQRSHSDSDEGLGLERKDSSRENSPAEKEYRRTTEYTNYGSDLRRNNEINSFKSSRYVDDVSSHKTVPSHFLGNNFSPRAPSDSKSPRRHGFDDVDRNLFDRPAEKYTSTVFVDTSGRGTADGMDSRRRENVERFTPGGTRQTVVPTSKTSELSARRDLLESRIKSRLHTDEMFVKSNGISVAKKTEHEIIDKPIVPSPITPNRVASPKRYTDTYITETRTNSNGEKYIFEKEIHEDNGKVYGYEKKITNKIPGDAINVEAKPRNGYTVETRTDKYGDKYIVETRTHEGYADGFKPFLSDKSRNSPEGARFPVTRSSGSPYRSTNYIVPDAPSHRRIETPETLGQSSPHVVRKIREHKFSKSEDFLDRETRPVRDSYVPKSKKNFESIRGMSKSTQRLDEVGENSRVKALRSEYITRSHENLSSADYVNGRDIRRDVTSPTRMNGRKERTTLVKRHLEDLRERPNDDYDTDISQLTNSQLESSKYYKETRTTQRYSSSKANNLNDDYDSSPPRLRKGDHRVGGYSSSRYDSDTTARDSTRCESRYVDERSSSSRKEHPRKLMESEPKKPLRRSRNRLDYFDDSDTRESPRGKSTSQRLETFDESPTMPERVFHETKVRHLRHETRGHVERRSRETRLSDTDRKDRLADSGIENDYRRDSQEADRREALESDDEGFVTTQFIKHERRHTDRNMNLTPSERRKYDKYVAAKRNDHVITSKPPTGTDKKYEKKVAKKSGTMSKVKQLFSKKEKKAKEEKSKSKSVRSGSSGALTDDEVTMRYREYRGDQLRSARSARDLESDVNQPVDKKPRIPESEILTTGTEDEEASSAPERVSVQKNLRFFGDTDQESFSSNRERRSKRSDDHASARCDVTISSSRQNLSVPTPPRKPPRLAESALSSGESTTGDSSQQSQNSQRSQRSVVYLHAATVGEIPGPNERRRAASRDELNRPLQSHTKTVSRSVSVLAPWKPRHYREPFEINYDQQQHHQKPPTTMKRRQRSRETLSRRGKEPRRSKDNLSKTGTINRSTLKSKDKQKVDRTVSTESLASKSRNGNSRVELSRSTSVPRDPNKSAGWFKIKSKKSRA
ncbi:uncharacterized protein blo isoform X2 [Venturia canescens]|uniref:uncharacterized protein blo isoform X2 n=1 Tax=Venturia canescens TaxID=32260 RepID=UPI001C9D12FD|nr:uncharacterized protein LOC122412676 isoform X2 [Venturia canescens]